MKNRLSGLSFPVTQGESMQKPRNQMVLVGFLAIVGELCHPFGAWCRTAAAGEGIVPTALVIPAPTSNPHSDTNAILLPPLPGHPANDYQMMPAQAAELAPALRRPLAEVLSPPAVRPGPPRFPGLLKTDRDPPLGYTGPSSIKPTEAQRNSDFVPIEDRWRIGFPFWSRSETKRAPFEEIGVDSPYELGQHWDPYNQNVLKGDYPIIGQHTFLDVTASTLILTEGRQIPTATTPRESTARPGTFDFFGHPDQFVYFQNAAISFDLFHGDAGFKPFDWRIRLTPVFNVNNLSVQELGVVSPDALAGTTRTRMFYTLQEYFVEAKLKDTSPYYDFLSLRIGSQPFVSDFRGFIFADTNRGIRLFGNRNANRDQFNLAYFYQAEKETNSGLNTFSNRQQSVVVANYYRQDFLIPGYTTQLSFHYNNDEPSTKFDKNRFLVRPDPAGVFQPHELDIFYLGWAGDGHIGRYNLSHAFYWALGHDSLNPIANRPVFVNAQMFAIELSYDRDWARFRSSFLYASGDGNVNNAQASGFDSILDFPNFAGGTFSFWQRQAIPLFGVNLVQRQSLLPDLRSSKIQGQSNFVNPGLLLPNFGVDFDLTPKLRMVNNCNFLWFQQIDPLKRFLFSGNVHHFIGTDLSSGIEYRPLLSNNIIVEAGVSTLLPGLGFSNLYDNLTGPVDALVAGFIELALTY